MKQVELVVVCENTACGAAIIGEHGLCWWVHSQGQSMLFDTGQGLTLKANASQLQIDLKGVEAVLLSHGHYDHVGGLPEFVRINRHASIYAHPACLEPKYGLMANGNGKLLSLAFLTSKKERATWEKRLKLIEGPAEIIPGVYATGAIPRRVPFETNTGENLYLDRKLLRRDPMLDDVALYFETNKGIGVILGCAHAGVINTLTHIETLTSKPIAAVFGGMHLLHADLGRVSKTIRELRRIGSPVLYPNHCTGMAAIHRLYQAFPGNVHCACAGMRWALPAAAN